MTPPQRNRDTGRCRSCGAPVVWARMHATGRPNPLEADQVPSSQIARGGVVALYPDATGIVLPRDAEKPPEATLHISHFATCPNRQRHAAGLHTPPPGPPQQLVLDAFDQLRGAA